MRERKRERERERERKDIVFLGHNGLMKRNQTWLFKKKNLKIKGLVKMKIDPNFKSQKYNLVQSKLLIYLNTS